MLTPLAAEGTAAAEDAPGIAFFRAIKSMTITGYCTIEIGLRQELGDDGRMMDDRSHGGALRGNCLSRTEFSLCANPYFRRVDGYPALQQVVAG